MSRAIGVTDHAMVRWIERTGLADFAPIREALAESLSTSAEAARQIGVSNYLILADGMVFVVKDGTVVTVTPEDGRHRHARMLARRSTPDQPGEADDA